MTLHFPRIILSGALLFLAGCSGMQSSPERHASHAAHVLATQHFDPNTLIKVTDSARMMTPLMTQFYEQGKKDRASGLSVADAQKKEADLYSKEFASRFITQESFINRQYNLEDPAKRKTMIDAMAASYRDGFEGRP